MLFCSVVISGNKRLEEKIKVIDSNKKMEEIKDSVAGWIEVVKARQEQMANPENYMVDATVELTVEAGALSDEQLEEIWNQLEDFLCRHEESEIECHIGSYDHDSPGGASVGVLGKLLTLDRDKVEDILSYEKGVLKLYTGFKLVHYLNGTPFHVSKEEYDRIMSDFEEADCCDEGDDNLGYSEFDLQDEDTSEGRHDSGRGAGEDGHEE